MKRQILAAIMALLIIVTGPMSQLYANVQIPVDSVSVDEVFYVLGQDPITGETAINPTMTVSWQDPAEWANAPNPADIHEPEYYNVVVYNRTKNITSTIKVNEGTPEFTDKTVQVHEKINLDPGCFYEVKVLPFHDHLNADGETYSPAPSSGIADIAYAITDLNVSLETTESTIKVIWDDLGVQDIEYQIVYATGDYSSHSKADLINNKEGQITGITSADSEVTRYYDADERRYKLSYTVDERIYPGQVYSIMVEPTVNLYNGEPIMRNRNFPIIRTCSTNVPLNVYEEGDYLKLEWEIPPSFKVGQNQDEYSLTQATLVQFIDGISSNIAIFNAEAATVGYYTIPRPNQETEYQILFVYEAVDPNAAKPKMEPVSNIAVYVPSELLVTPTKPVIPNLFTQEILTSLLNSGLSDVDIQNELKKNYFVSGYSYSGNFGSLLSQNNTYHIIESTNEINLIWEAFKRIDVDTTSDTYGLPIYDINVYYDICVTDTLQSLAYATEVVSDKRFSKDSTANNLTDGTDIFGYSQVISTYYNDTSKEIEPIVPGKLYYIKIVAKKRTSIGDLESEPAIVAVYYSSNGDAYAPPTIAKPPLEVKDETDTTITLTWEEAWWEVMAQDTVTIPQLAELDTWRHEVWVDEATGDVYAKVPTGGQETEYFSIYEGEDEIERFLEYLIDDIGLPETDVRSSITSREIDLGQDAFGMSDIQYNFYRMPYAQVLNDIESRKQADPTYNFDTYFQEMITADKQGQAPIDWEIISPTIDPNNSEKLIFTEDGLTANTSYLFIVYPYRVLQSGETLYAHYPTPIVVSTKPEDSDVNPDPTVPNLYIDSTSDTSITLKWKYNKDFTYELVYALFDDVTKAQPVEWTLPTDETDPNYPVDGDFYPLVVDDLFPDTEYYFWIRAIQPANNTPSHWSNSVLGKTDDVDNPIPPRGFGIAALESMKKYDYDKAVTKDYITVEWILDTDDVEQSQDQTVKKEYSYIIEISDNSKFIDPILIESTGGSKDVIPSSVEILQKNLVKINELVPNRVYYIRAKTRVTVTGSENGQLIIKDSESYTPTIRIVTSSTTDEYDGTIDPDLEILPSEDYELIYHKDDKELEFRFRDNEEDSEGEMDNNVDQRLISKLIAQNTYIYDIDISNYKNKTIEKWAVSIPFSVIEAFNTYKVSMLIDAGDIMLEIPYGALSSEVNYQANYNGGAPMVRIEMESLGSDYVEKQLTAQSIRPITDSIDVEIYVRNSNKEKDLYYTDKEINVKLMTNNKYEQFRVNRVGAIKDYQSNWHTEVSDFDSSTGYMSFDTSKVGVYSGYVIEDSGVFSTNQGHWSETYRKLVASEYTIKGLMNYYPDSAISESQLINVMYAIAIGQNTVDLNGYITKDMMTALKNSRVKLNESSAKTQVTREEAISMFTRVYELINEDVIEPSTASTNAANNNRNISSAYKLGMAKAATVGLISSIDQSRPKDALTYGELFALWSKIIQ